MADRDRAETALAERLRQLGTDLTFPPTPPLVPAVLERLESPRARRPVLPAGRDRRRAVIAVAVGLLVALALAFGARLVLGAAEIRVQPGVTPSGPPLGPGGLGEPVAVEELEAAVGFELALPPGPPPDEAYAVRTADDRAGALLGWRGGPDHPPLPGTPWSRVLLQVHSDAETITKTVARFEDVRTVTVRGRPGFWIDVPHDLIVRTETRFERYSVGGNVLIWTEGDVTYRLETSLRLRSALALAEGVG
ncbi:MAG TPA: hypothetical protein VF129_12770 [Actinomycetota bacterium]